MARYIDADNLIHHDIEDINGDVLDVIHAADIDNAPTADVSPVRHGRWIEQENWALDDYYYTCSACGEDYNTIDGTPDYNFCPNCGARMDGDGK